MRLRNVTGSREVIAACDYVIHNERECRGKWKEIFGNNHPIRIEIGMGKGRFIMDLARQNPDINYIGIEKYSSVLIRGIQKLEADPLPNLYFIRMEAEEITTVFAEGEVDRIYLNFSDPWPKDRHAKRRLPSREFLRRYDEILIPDGVIEFKTDNYDLFQFALEELQMTEDLHHNAKMMEGNVMTEYEERFSSKGNPICKYVIAREKCQRTEAVKECSI